MTSYFQTFNSTMASYFVWAAIIEPYKLSVKGSPCLSLHGG